MGKSKPTKWFKAVKKAFRSPSKERPSSPDHQDTVDGDEKLLSKQHEHSPVRHPEPTPHPLPSFEIITYDEAEPEHSSRGQPFPQPLPTPEAVDPAIAAAAPSEKVLEDLIKEDGTRNNDVEALVMEKQQQDDDDDSISEEEEAAARIQQRFSEPLALKGLVRFQALVRGHQVRRQAATTLTTMEAIVRVQAVFRGRRVRVSKDGRAVRSRISKRRRLSSRAGHNGDASRGGYQFNASQIIRGEQEEYKHKRPTAYLLTQQLKRSAPKRSTLFIDCDPNQPHWGWAWLELWSNARPWEIRYVADSKGSKGSTNSKDFIEIIPSRKNSEYTTKEVDVNTLKVKYYEDYVSNPTPAAKSRSSNPMSEKKEPSGKSSAGPTYEKKEPAVKSSSPMQQHEKKEHAVKSSSPMQQHEKKEPVVKSSSPMLEKKEPIVKSSSPMFEKKEPFKSSTEKKEPTVKSTSSPKEPVNRSSSPMSEKKEPARSSEKKEPFRSARHLPEKKEFVRSSSSPLSEKKESIRSSWTSPLSEKKEPLRSPTSSSFSEKKEPLRSPPSPFSEKKEPLRSPSSPFSEQKELARSPSSPLSEKTEPEWPQMLSPVPTPTPPPETLPPHSHRVLPKPPPIEVPTLPATDLEEDSRPVQILDPKSPKSMPSSPAASDNSLPVPPSPLASDASLPVPETPPGLDSAGDDPSVTMEHLALPEAHSTNGGETNGTLNGETHSRSCSLSNVSNGEHQPGDDTPSAKGSTSEVANGHFSNGHQENGGSKSPKVDEAGENGDSPVPSKRPTCRYMVPTESAKAKFRSSSNPKTRAPDAPDSPVRTTTKRYSIGGSPTVSKGTDSPKTAFGTRKSHSFQNRATPNPKAGTPKEKPRSVETGAESPARRNSLGGDKRWRT